MSSEWGPNQTSAALLTAAGQGAVAVIRVQGSIDQMASAMDACFRAANGLRLSEQPLRAVQFGHWGCFADKHVAAEEVVVCRTAVDTVEINGHGGTAAVRRVLNDLVQQGIPTVSWLNQRLAAHRTSRHSAADMDQQLESVTPTRLIEACTQAITRATTRQCALRLLNQRDLWITALERWKQTQPSPSELAAIVSRTEFGRHLTEPWRIAICGRPNVGKSTLINALLGYERAIVFDQPGTTRDVVTGETVLKGWPICFADTAGLRETQDVLERAGIERARSQIETADARLLVLDHSQPLTAEDQQLIETLSALPRTLVVANKCDLRVSIPTGNNSHLAMPHDTVWISAALREGLDTLVTRLMQLLIPVEPADDDLLPVTEEHRQWLRGESLIFS